MPSTYVSTRAGWHDEFRKLYLDCYDRIQISESRGAVSINLTEAAKTLNRRAANEVRQGESHRVAIRGLELIANIGLDFERKLGRSVAVQRRDNEVMHRQIAKELAELLSVATGFYDIQLLRSGKLLGTLRDLHSTTGTCYEGILQDMESIVTELEEQDRVKQEPSTAMSM
jgi:hypothetical protein